MKRSVAIIFEKYGLLLIRKSNFDRVDSSDNLWGFFQEPVGPDEKGIDVVIRSVQENTGIGCIVASDSIPFAQSCDLRGNLVDWYRVTTRSKNFIEKVGENISDLKWIRMDEALQYCFSVSLPWPNEVVKYLNR